MKTYRNCGGGVYNSSGTFSFVDLDFNDAILKLLKKDC